MFQKLNEFEAAKAVCRKAVLAGTEGRGVGVSRLPVEAAFIVLMRVEEDVAIKGNTDLRKSRQPANANSGKSRLR